MKQDVDLSSYDSAQAAINTHPRIVVTHEVQRRLSAELARAQEREVAAGLRVAEIEEVWKRDLGTGHVAPLAASAMPARAALAEATREVEAIRDALGNASGDSCDAEIDARADLLARTKAQVRPQVRVIAGALETLVQISRPLIQQLESARLFERGVGGSGKLADYTAQPLTNICTRIPDLLRSWRENGLVE